MRGSSKPKIKTSIGVVKKSKKSKGFYVEDNRESQFKLGKKEVYKIMPGDLVKFSLGKKEWAFIEEIVERNTKEFIGSTFTRGKKLYCSPIGFENDIRVAVSGDIPKTINLGSLVKVKMTKQPQEGQLAEAYIERTFTSGLELAYEIAISNHNIKTDWPKSVINEANKLKLNKEEDGHYKDLRDKTFVTIDGKSAKDFDDAVLGEKDKEGNFILYVAIADVARFVKQGSVIDLEAAERGTSVYFTQRVVPMLPEIISNDLCSLRPNEDRFCLVCKTVVDKNGTLKDSIFFEAQINSKARLTYENLSEEIEKDKLNKTYSKSIKNLLEIYERLKRNKENRGALELEVPFYVPKFNDNKIAKFTSSERTITHMMIEEFMLAANIATAEICLKFNMPSLYRVHPKPDLLKINHLRDFVRSRKINVKLDEGNSVSQLSKLVEMVEDRKDKQIMHLQILQSLSLATYEAEVSEHFALGYKAYSHFTSPIRRYPDLIVHRTIKKLIEANNGSISINDSINPNKPYSQDNLEKLAAECSTKERNAEKAERDALNHLKCEFAHENIGNSFNGQITGVTNFGLFIHLLEVNIEGLCHIKHLPKNEYYVYDESSQMLQSNSSKHSYSLGDFLKVKIEKVDVFSQRVDLRILK
jgi:ribonuclease R